MTVPFDFLRTSSERGKDGILKFIIFSKTFNRIQFVLVRNKRKKTFVTVQNHASEKNDRIS